MSNRWRWAKSNASGARVGLSDSETFISSSGATCLPCSGTMTCPHFADPSHKRNVGSNQLKFPCLARSRIWKRLDNPRHSKTNFPLPHYWRLWLIGSDRERMCHYTVDSCTCQCTEKDRGSQTSLATKIGLAGGLWLSSCLLGAKHKVPFPVLMAMIFLPIFMTTI